MQGSELILLDGPSCAWHGCGRPATKRLVLHGQALNGEKRGMIEAGINGAIFCQAHSNQYRRQHNTQDNLRRWLEYLDSLTPPDQSLVRGSLQFVERELM